MSSVGVRLPDDLLEKLDRLSDAEGLDRSTVIRQLLERGYDAFMRERAADRYRRGEVTMSEAADLTECTVWEFERYLVQQGYRSSYTIDDLKREREAIVRRRES